MKRAAARALGLTRYSTGKPCPHGHMTERYSISGQCIECWRLKRNRLRLAKRERRRAEILASGGQVGKVSTNPRAVARLAGLDRYQGKPCRKGHDSWRYVSSATCIGCQQAANRAINQGGRPKLTGKVTTEEARRKRRIKDGKYKARKRAASGKLTATEVRWLFERQKGKCALCFVSLKKIPWEVDHWISLKGGGSNDLSNRQIACVPCNRSKGATDPIVHAQRRLGRLL